ncbi:hypothetical protein [Nostocoides australiense]
MIGQLRLHPTFQDRLDHFRQKAGITRQRDTTLIGRGHQLVQHDIIEEFTPKLTASSVGVAVGSDHP